jgi:hypothetical protein
MAYDLACKCICLNDLAEIQKLGRALTLFCILRTNLTEATRAMIKRSTEDVKKLASWPSEPTGGVRSLRRCMIRIGNHADIDLVIS